MHTLIYDVQGRPLFIPGNPGNVEVDKFDALRGQAEVMELTITGAEGGTFRLGNTADQTGDLAHDINAGSLQTAINGLTGITGSVVALDDGVFTIAFTYAQGESGLVIDDDSLTPAGAEIELVEVQPYIAALAQEPTLQEVLAGVGAVGDAAEADPAADATVIAALKGVLETAGEVDDDPTANTMLARLKAIYEALIHFSEASVDTGVATDGSQTTIVDTDKHWQTDIWQNALAEVVVDGVHYLRMCSGNTEDTVTIAALPAGVEVGDGDRYQLKIPVHVQDIERWGGTQLTGRDISADLRALTDDAITGVLRSLGDAGAGDNALTRLTAIATAVGALQTGTETLQDVVDAVGALQEGAWTLHQTSAANTAVSVVKAAEEDKKHFISAIEVATRGAETANDIIVTLLDGADVKWQTCIGEEAGSGERVGMTLTTPIEMTVNTAVTLEAGAGGAGVVVEVNMAGVTR